MRELVYNRKKAVEYAQRWALMRNGRYYNFDNIGGDCTNFASQCIYAGSGIMNYSQSKGWFYISLSKRSPSWTGVEFLYDFLIKNKGVGPYGIEVERFEIEQGDIVQLGHCNSDFYHTAIVLEALPEILVAAHTYDSLNRALSTYNYDIVRFIHIQGVRAW